MTAIMHAVASRGKGKQGKIPDVDELYNRNSTAEPEKAEDVFEKQKEAMDWLSNFNIKVGDDDEEEDDKDAEEDDKDEDVD